ncbi:MAG: hypothetical protein PVG39_27705 [Desulfobacteraceae bacterium]|jgi:hypothetical protein
MDICKNNTTGNYFIYINGTGAEEAVFVTPNAEIKNLQLELFTKPEKYPEEFLLEKNFITKEQSQRFHEYKKDRADEVSENYNE